MAIKLIANYSKRLGLPGYSSHQFSVSVETELVATDNIAQESERLYQLLQSNVDEQILHTGFVPAATYGMVDTSTKDSRLSSSTVENITPMNRNASWKCSSKQKDLILKLVDEHQLDKSDVEALAVERFGKGVRVLNKIESSGLIDELLETYGSGNRSEPHNSGRRNGSAYQGRERRDAA